MKPHFWNLHAGLFLAVALTSSPLRAQVANAQASHVILLNSGAIDTAVQKTARSARRITVSASAGKQMRLIQFAGPIRPEWYEALVATGVRIVTYIPQNAYLVYGNGETLRAVQSLADDKSLAQWEDEYLPAFRLHPALARSSSKTTTVTIQMVDDTAENKATLALIEQSKLKPIIQRDRLLGYLNVTVELPRAAIDQLAQRGDVVSIQPWSAPEKQDERQNIIMSGNVSGTPAIPMAMDYLSYLASKGFSTSTTSSFAINLSDSGIDNATTTPTHFALYRAGDPQPANSRIIYNRLEGTPNLGSTLEGCDGHGNLNAHILGGYVPSGTVGGVNFGAFPHADASGFRYGLGLAPFVKIGSSVIFDPVIFTAPNYSNLESKAYNDGARISNNSWSNSTNSYNAAAQQYDALVRDAQPAGSTFPTAGNQEYTIVFSAGNYGFGASTIGWPATAKNVITVGAAESVNAFGGVDNCGIADTSADNANDIANFSSRGPTSDGRQKPDVVAPGTHVTGGVGQASIVAPAGSGTGSAQPCFNGAGICGGPGGSLYFPTGQQWYVASSGSSHATPEISGFAALIRQHFLNQSLTPPSPAMTKALILNSARYLTGAGAGDTLPSNSQGMGEGHLNGYFDLFAASHTFHDQFAGETFTASGQQRAVTGSVSDGGKPFRVTLVWTDAPGSTTGAAYVNDLDLEVVIGGNTYKGNVFSGAFSSTGGVADARNNVETVALPAGLTGSFVIKVKATNIAGDGVPNNAQPLDQDFALVVSNAVESPAPVIVNGGAAIVAESCSTNDAIDPGETVTLNFGLTNIGAANTSILVATLQPTGGVIAPSAPQNYGSLLANGAVVSRQFTFIAGTTCGMPLTATFQLQDGATNLGTVTFTFNTGAPGSATTSLFSSGALATAIPDPGTIDIPINISDLGVVTDVNVRVRANHAYDSDVQMSLISPSGIIVPLVTNRGSSVQNFGSGSNDCSGTYTVFDDSAAVSIAAGAAPFAGSYRPETPLSAFNGSLINGTWTLRVTDTVAQDSGTLGCVVLEITRQPFVCCGSPPVAVSRKVHGGAGIFDIRLPLTGTSGVECRTSQGTNDYQVVVTFADSVVVNGAPQATVSGSAQIGSSGVPNGGAVTVSGNVVTIPLTNVANAQRLTISLPSVTVAGSTTSVSIPMGVLAGDVNSTSTVSAADVSQTKAQTSAGVTAATFRSDVTVNGTINAADVSLVKARSGTFLP